MGAMILTFGNPGSWSLWSLKGWAKGMVMFYLLLCDT